MQKIKVAGRLLVSVLALLDLSTALDCLDHGVVLEWLCKSFGVTGVDRDWLAVAGIL